MKKLMSLLICIVFTVSVSAQKSKVESPAAAKSAFAAKYPTAQKAKWGVEKPGEFEVEFTLNGVASSALFDTAGKFLESEATVKNADLPQAVKATIAKDFEGFKLNEILKSTDAKGVISFEITAGKGKEKLSLDFDANGKLLSKESLKKEEKEEKEDK